MVPIIYRRGSQVFIMQTVIAAFFLFGWVFAAAGKNDPGDPPAGQGKLEVDLVNSRGVSVSYPVIAFTQVTTAFLPTVSDAVLGTDDLQIVVSNDRSNPLWTLALSGIETETWNGGSIGTYAYNDDRPNGRGQLTVDPSMSLITPSKKSCGADGLLRGSSASFTQGEVSSITLLTANSSASKKCSWYITNINLHQTIPPAQPAGEYFLNLVLTVS